MTPDMVPRAKSQQLYLRHQWISIRIGNKVFLGNGGKVALAQGAKLPPFLGATFHRRTHP
jgi:hypothetical protein